MSAPGASPPASRLIGILRPDRLYRDVRDGLALVIRHRRLVLAMASRDLRLRYAGQITGSFWVIGHPMFQMLLFVFVFGVIFKQRVGGTLELPRDYTTYILSGLIPWLAINPAVSASCHSIISNANIVRQFTFETELLPVKDVAISMVFWMVGVAILAVYSVVVDRSLPATYLLLPIVLALHLLLVIGLGWLLASVSVFFRDMKDIVTVLTTAGVYVLPIVYLPQWVPDVFKPVIWLNPFSSVIWAYQDVLYFGRIEHPEAWGVFAAFAVLSFGFGWRVFRRLKPHFGGAL